eukprot:Hpha_TRINITY_DN824_c0_g1::TRINITY_DN824_c0_g1_i1::g.194887::m.194887
MALAELGLQTSYELLLRCNSSHVHDVDGGLGATPALGSFLGWPIHAASRVVDFLQPVDLFSFIRCRSVFYGLGQERLQAYAARRKVAEDALNAGRSAYMEKNWESALDNFDRALAEYTVLGIRSKQVVCMSNSGAALDAVK